MIEEPTLPSPTSEEPLLCFGVSNKDSAYSLPNIRPVGTSPGVLTLTEWVAQLLPYSEE